MGILDQNLGTPTPESPVVTPSYATGIAGLASGLLDVASSFSTKKETGGLTEKQIFDMEGDKLAGDVAKRAKAAENQGKFRLRDSIVSEGIIDLAKRGYDVGSFASTFSAFGVPFEETMSTDRDRRFAAVKDNPTFQANLVAAIGQFNDVDAAKDYALSMSVNQESRRQALMEGTAGGLRSVPGANAYLNDIVQTELNVANTFTNNGVLFTKDQVAQREAIYSGEALRLRGAISASYGSDNASRIEALKIFDEADAGRRRIFKEIGELAELDLETGIKEYYINAISGLISASTKGLTHTDDKGNVTVIPDSVARMAISAYKQMSINDDKLGATDLQKQGYNTMIKLMELVTEEPSVATKWGFESQLQAETENTPKTMFDDTPTPAGSDVKKTIDGLAKLTNEFKGVNNPEAKQLAFLTAGQSAGVIAKVDGVLSAKDAQALAMSGYKKLAQDIGRTDPAQGRALAFRWGEAHKMQEQKANRAMADLGVGLFDGDGNIKSDGLLSAASEAVSRMNGQEKLSAINLLQTLDQVANEAYGGDKLAAIEDRGSAFGRLGTEERRFFAVLNSEEYFGDSRIEKYKGFRNARDTHRLLKDSWNSDVKSYDKKETLPDQESTQEPVAVAPKKTEQVSSVDYTTLIDKLAEIESNNNPDAVSSKGALGKYQIMPASAKDPGFGVDPIDITSATDEEQRVFVEQYLKAMEARYSDMSLALAAYNAGPGTIDKFINGGPLPKETRDYVRKFVKKGVIPADNKVAQLLKVDGSERQLLKAYVPSSAEKYLMSKRPVPRPRPDPVKNDIVGMAEGEYKTQLGEGSHPLADFALKDAFFKDVRTGSLGEMRYDTPGYLAVVDSIDPSGALRKRIENTFRGDTRIEPGGIMINRKAISEYAKKAEVSEAFGQRYTAQHELIHKGLNDLVVKYADKNSGMPPVKSRLLTSFLSPSSTMDRSVFKALHHLITETFLMTTLVGDATSWKDLDNVKSFVNVLRTPEASDAFYQIAVSLQKAKENPEYAMSETDTKAFKEIYKTLVRSPSRLAELAPPKELFKALIELDSLASELK